MSNPSALRVFRDSAKFKGEFTLGSTNISVNDVLNLIDQGYTKKEIVDHYDGQIKERHCDVCLTIATHHMPDHPCFRKNNKGNKKAFILLDENQPYVQIPKVLNRISKIEHISFHGLATKSDDRILEFLIQNKGTIIVTNDDDFIHHVEMIVMHRMYESGTFDVDVHDIPFIGFVDRNDHQTHLSERALKTRIQNLVKTASNKDRQTLWMCIDEDKISSGLTPKQVFHRFVRGSIAGAVFDHPFFAKNVVDYNMLWDVQRKYGYDLIPVSEKSNVDYDAIYRELHAGQSWKRNLPKNDPRLVA